MGILDGKVAIVTGSGHGIGRGEALELAGQGARVVINDVGGSARGEGTDKSAADEVVEVIRARGGEAVANYDDVADFAGAENIVATAYEAFGGHDIVVNNAGIIRDKMIVSMSEDDFDAVLRVHLKGTFAVTKLACVRWRDRFKSGENVRAAVVNTVSSAGLQGNVGQANYGSAKGGYRRADHHHLARGGALRGAGERGGAGWRHPSDGRRAQRCRAERARRVHRRRIQPPQSAELGAHGGLAGLG